MKTTLKKSILKSRLLIAVICFVVFHSISMAQTSWNTNGNAGSFSNFIGTTNNYPFLFRTNSVERMRIQPNGFVGIGVANPLQRLDVFGNLRVRGNVYVDQRVFQEGQFASDSIDAGLINASNMTANRIDVDSLKSYVYVMDSLSKFVGTAKFENYLFANQGIIVGQATTDVATISGPPSDPSLKFEVRGGDSKFGGDVDIVGALKIPNINEYLNGYPQTSGSFRLLSVDEFGVLKPSTVEIKYSSCPSNPVLAWKARPGEALISLSDGTTLYGPNLNHPDDIIKCPLEGNVGIGTFTPNYKLDILGDVNASGFRINSVPLFLPWENSNGNIKFTNGNVGIGIDNPTEKLHVNGNTILNGDLNTIGNIKTKKVIICADGWCDYVFDKKYKLKSLFEVEKFIEENKHLPGIPSVKEIENKEVDIFQIQKMQMEKIEELTLYIIQLKKEIDNLKK